MCQRAVPQGRLKVTQDMVLGWLTRIANSPFQRQRHPRIASWVIFSRPCGTGPLSNLSPGLTSWATLSRPSGTQFGEGVLTQTLKAVPFRKMNFSQPVDFVVRTLRLACA